MVQLETFSSQSDILNISLEFSIHHTRLTNKRFYARVPLYMPISATTFLNATRRGNSGAITKKQYFHYYFSKQLPSIAEPSTPVIYAVLLLPIKCLFSIFMSSPSLSIVVRMCVLAACDYPYPTTAYFAIVAAKVGHSCLPFVTRANECQGLSTKEGCRSWKKATRSKRA